MDNFVSNLTTYLILTHLTLDIYLCLDHEVVKHFPFGRCRLFIYPIAVPGFTRWLAPLPLPRISCFSIK